MKDIRAAVTASKAGRLHRMTGGATHSDEAADRKLVKKMVKPEARTGRAAGGSTKAKANGGKSHKSKPSMTIVIAPQGQVRPVPVPVPSSGGATAVPGPTLSRAPASPPPAKQPIPVKQVAPQQGMLGPINSKNGGKIKKRADGGSVKFTAGAATGKGRLEKVDAQRAKGGK
jgi:hypothetical protein